MTISASSNIGSANSSSAQRTAERGSAMLIVFVFAAVVAIMLYRELPVTVFEARRQKEQLLVDRGHEYIRAVQLFYRRNRGQYPASIDQLENTNGIRFLRHRFKDPLTGKDDWRLLHAAGPGGQLIDSKVNPLRQNGTDSGSNNGQSGFGANSSGQSAFGQTNTGQGNTNQGSGSGQSGFGQSSSSSSDTPPEVMIPPLHERPPAVSASGSDTPSTPSSSDLDQNPATPLLASSSDSGGQSNTAQSGSGQPGAGTPGSPGTGGQPGQNVMQSLQPVLTSGVTGQQSQSGFGQFGAGSGPRSPQGQIMGGALAGVASKAGGHTIKLINDQSNYSLWEFYYDPSKDKALSPTGGGSAAGVMPTGTNGQSNSGFGANSGFAGTNFPINTSGTSGNAPGQPTDPSSGIPPSGNLPSGNPAPTPQPMPLAPVQSQ